MVEKRWTIPQVDESAVTTLKESLKVHPVICRMLALRGIDTFEKAKDFYRPQLEQLHSPWGMKDMHKAVDRLMKAFAANEHILVYGDYDVDGTTSVACMYQFLCSVYDKQKLDFYIPHRYKEGYGISKAGIEYAKEKGYTLIVALDCGIKSAALIEMARNMGIDFIVCDHHLPDAVLPPAVAILNPKQSDCPYPYKELCGCGVGFKLITALTEQLNLPLDDYAYRYLDLVATAIAADIVPITGENRILAYHGLLQANTKPSLGIAALMQLSGIQQAMQIQNLVFMIAPRVNAAGRMDDAKKAVQMFIAETLEEAMQYAEMLHADNYNRKEKDSSITAEALEMIQNNPALQQRKSTVLFQPHWHKGVVGIVASRLTEHYYRPTIVLTQSGDVLSGSARSVAGFNLYEAIHACREHLVAYGGHFAAAGLSLLPENLEAFSTAFESAVSSTIDPQLLIPEIVIDAEINFNDIQMPFYNIIQQMEPFGPENMKPVFVSRNVHDKGFSKVVKEEHLRFVLQQNQHTLTGIAFGKADMLPILQQGPVDVVYHIEKNEYNGITSLQLRVIDFRPSESKS